MFKVPGPKDDNYSTIRLCVPRCNNWAAPVYRRKHSTNVMIGGVETCIKIQDSEPQEQ
jgi:hypothetical protein